MELMQASRQWSTRSPDERFDNLDALYNDSLDDAKHCKELSTNLGYLKVEPVENNGLAVRGNKGVAVMTNFAFEQLLRKIDYPAGGITKNDIPQIPAELAAQVINHRISETGEDEIVKILVHSKNDVHTIRSITSSSYARVWDAQIIQHLTELPKNGWKVPPARPAFQNQPGTRPATEEDCLYLNKRSGLAIKPGDPIAPAGLYRGDRDMFCFFTNVEDSTDDGGGNGLTRVLFVSNSEVGARSFKITEALCQEVCGNHIVWGAQDIVTVRYKHIGEAVAKIKECLENLVDRLAPRDLTKELQVIDWMRNNKLGLDLDDVVTNAYTLSMKAIAKKNIKEAIMLCEEHRKTDGDPYSWYGVTNGLTRLSQREKNVDSRMTMDVATSTLFDKAAVLCGV